MLEQNNLVTKSGEKIELHYFVSAYLEVNTKTFNETERKLDKSK